MSRIYGLIFDTFMDIAFNKNFMKQLYAILTAAFFISVGIESISQTVWDGPTTVFTKENNADWTLEENQDRITDNVWITRANNGGLFNIANEESTDGGTGLDDDPFPTDTEWAYGTTADFMSLSFQPLSPLIGENFSSIVDGQDMVIHLITDDIYIDIKFLSWTSGGNGGGFSYERSTDASSSVAEVATTASVKLFPNPTTEFVQVAGLASAENFILFNILGGEVKTGIIADQGRIDVSELNEGIYFLKFNNGQTIRFVKK